MIDWKEEVNKVLRNLGLEELSYTNCIQLIVELYTKHNKSLQWIQNEFFNHSVTWTCIRKLLLSEGVKLRGRGGPNRKKVIIPVEELKTNTLHQLSKKYGVSVTTVLARRKEHDIRLRHRKPLQAEEGIRPPVD